MRIFFFPHCLTGAWPFPTTFMFIQQIFTGHLWDYTALSYEAENCWKPQEMPEANKKAEPILLGLLLLWSRERSDVWPRAGHITSSVSVSSCRKRGGLEVPKIFVSAQCLSVYESTKIIIPDQFLFFFFWRFPFYYFWRYELRNEETFWSVLW